ncbi:hypothetical protein KDW_42420 [Dictyobacter vulcani]|uniref:Inner membrane component domain-containing protein n=2 Tax=Dictyobacter vulcani TaxID=2607529 RepID=A0A5J4KUD1_9CHLR|nr:hypothetical protein KDW_42420 [Dictyobacter vulcani]
MAQNVNVTINNGKQHGFFIRALYFCFIGWWLGFAWLNVGYFCVLSVVLLPLGLVMLNRLPQVMTLRSSSGTSTNINVSTTMVQPGMGAPGVMQNSININVTLRTP